MEIALNTLTPGEGGVVAHLSANGSLRQRLQDMGFVPGALVRCLFAAPAGDPQAYWICGACIALRKRDAAQITVIPLG